jgi:hypothetical protein
MSPCPRPPPATSRQIDWMFAQRNGNLCGVTIPRIHRLQSCRSYWCGLITTIRNACYLAWNCVMSFTPDPPPGSGSVPSIPGYLTLMPRADPEGATISSMSTPVACFLCQDHPWAQVHFLSSRSPPVSGGQSYIYTPAPPGIRPTLSIFISLSLN